MSRLLQDLLARQAEERADATALVLGPTRVSYGELEEESNRLARLLEAAGCARGDRVCLFLPKSPEAVISMLAVLKADCAYVPIDLASPAPRVARIVQSAEPCLALVAAEALPLVNELLGSGALDRDVAIGTVEPEAVAGPAFESRFSRADWSAFDPTPPPRANVPDDLAHILFTSGSTGMPKGVMITHRNVLHFVDWATAYFGMRPGDRISGHPPLHFDLSTFDIFGAFHAGAELHLVPPQANLLPTRLADLIRSAELTQWFSVPSAMTLMAAFGVVQPGAFPSLERVLWCGEVLPTPVLQKWMDAVPQARFTNLYGPTEATIASSYYTVPARPASETEPIPIGTPCPGEELLVLDDDLRPVPPGEVGSLYIAGVGLSPGYWRDAERTQEAFVPDPRSPEGGTLIYRTGDLARMDEDGLVYFLGRADSQIKSRGYRIELGEIESALNAIDEVSESAVVGVETDRFEGVSICCAYALAPGASLEPPALRERLRTQLPAYMLPAAWLRLETLPKNVNGKIDRRLIRDLFAARAPEADASEAGADMAAHAR